MPTVIRDMDYGEGGPTYRIHYEITSPGRPAQTYGPPEHCHPAEPAEWTITGIDAELPHGAWVEIEKVQLKHEVESVYAWAEGLDLVDEVAEDVEAERIAEAEFRADLRSER